MADYAMRSDLDLLRQQLQSDPAAGGFPFLRSVPMVVDRSYQGVAGPASDQWDRFYTFSGRGGLLNPDRQLEFKLMMEASNFSGMSLYWLVRALLGGTTFWEADGLLVNGETQSIVPTFRIIATGGNAGQLIEVTYGGGVPANSSTTENLADGISLTVDATWRDEDGGGPAETLTPTNDAYVIRYHALAVLT